MIRATPTAALARRANAPIRESGLFAPAVCRALQQTGDRW